MTAPTIREAALRAAFESMRDRIAADYTLEQFEHFNKDAEVVPVMVGDDLAGAIIIIGPEIHACILPAYFGKWLSKRVLRDTLKRVIDRHGYASTHVTKGNRAGEWFVRRLGFVDCGEKNGIIEYRMVKNGT